MGMSHVPYTYLLCFTHPQTLERKFYYGVQYAQGCNPTDFFVSYYTHSTHVRRLLSEFGKECFTWEIRKVFLNNPKKAHEWEQRVLHRLRAPSRSDFLNYNVGGKEYTKFGEANPSKRLDVRAKISLGVKKFFETHEPFFKGQTHSKATKEQISKKMKAHGNKAWTQERRKAQSEARKGWKVPEYEIQRRRMALQGAGNPMFGRTSAANHLNQVKEICPYCQIKTTRGNIKRWHGENCKAKS
jgi:hypothetical protein